jgi:diguanylate cyclase (GGDEF)-like protein
VATATIPRSSSAGPQAIAAAALDLLADGVLVVCDGEVVVANRALCRMTGLRPEDLLGGPAPGWVPAAPADGEELEAEAVVPAAHGRRRRVTAVVAARVLPGVDGVAQVVTVRDRSADAAREAELVRRADRDGLTGLLNKRSFDARLAEEAERLAARGRPLSLVVLDLDHFKAVNDEHGHPTGDRVLAEAARRITDEARAIDSVGRVGGEEFAWLLPDASAEEALVAAERLRAAIAARPFADGLRVTASIGVCDLAAAGGTPEALVERADQALCWAKAHGRDTALRWSAGAADVVGCARGLTGAPDDRVAALARIADAAEPGPAAGHGRRVADLSVALAAQLDWSPTRQARLHRAACVHDVGKALVAPELLARRGPLHPVGAAHVRSHPTVGAALARSALDAEQQRWVRHHHERWDGAGYPDGLAGEEIPDGAQILALADAWDAMTSDRPYRAALGADEALAGIERLDGAQFPPGSAALLRAALAWWAAAER